MTLEELVQLCREAYSLQAQVKALEVQAATIQQNLTRLEQELIPEGMLGLGMTSVTVDGTEFSLKKSYKARLTESKTPAAIAYLAAHGFGDIIKAQLITEFGADDTTSISELVEMAESKGLTAVLKNTVHPNTLSAFVREQAEAGTLTDEMSDLLSVYTQYSVKLKETK